jgi:hypothetical protein
MTAMPALEILASSGLGALLGLRHAFEPDHLVAVSTLASHERGGIRGALLGLFWGAGHTLALVLVGAVLVVLQTEMPQGAVTLFELLVAVMLVGLGVRAIRQAARQGPSGPDHVHRHGRIVHRHAGMPAHVHVGSWTFARRPLLVGIVHGLAGTGALTALVLTTLPSTGARLVYMVQFGVGSTLGMAVLSGFLGWPLARLGAHHAVCRVLSFAVGCLSTVLGVMWGYSAYARF